MYAADLEHLRTRKTRLMTIESHDRPYMELTPREKDKLLIFTAALLAERRKGQRPQAQLPGSGGVTSAPPSWKARATGAPSRS